MFVSGLFLWTVAIGGLFSPVTVVVTVLALPVLIELGLRGGPAPWRVAASLRRRVR